MKPFEDLARDFERYSHDMIIHAQEADRDDEMCTCAVYQAMSRVWANAAAMLHKTLEDMKP